jgi:hypothetical protein
LEKLIEERQGSISSQTRATIKSFKGIAGNVSNGGSSVQALNGWFLLPFDRGIPSRDLQGEKRRIHSKDVW